MDNLETKLELMSLVNIYYCNSLIPYSGIYVSQGLPWQEKQKCVFWEVPQERQWILSFVFAVVPDETCTSQ